MRHPLVPALLVLLAVLGVAAAGMVGVGADPVSGGSPIADTSRMAATATVSGTVTGADGAAAANAYVVLEPVDGSRLAEAVDGDQAVTESVLKLAQTGDDDLHVTRTDDAGRYSLSVPPGTYRVIAVEPDGKAISQLRTVTVDGDVGVDLALDRGRVLAVDSNSTRAAPGSVATVELRVHNVDDEPVTNLTVTLDELPDGWTIVGVTTDGHYDAGARRLTWARVEAGELATATVRVQVPGNAATRRQDLPVVAESDAHFIEQFDAPVVRVRPANATPTPTAVGGPGVETKTPLDEGTPTGNESLGADTPTATTSAPVPGFGVAVALLALAGAALAARRCNR